MSALRRGTAVTHAPPWVVAALALNVCLVGALLAGSAGIKPWIVLVQALCLGAVLVHFVRVRAIRLVYVLALVAVLAAAIAWPYVIA